MQSRELVIIQVRYDGIEHFVQDQHSALHRDRIERVGVLHDFPSIPSKQVYRGICGAIASAEVHEMNPTVKWKRFHFCYIESAKVHNTIGLCIRDARDKSKTLWTDVGGLKYLAVCTWAEISTTGETRTGINRLCSEDVLGSCIKIR